ncbi:hypothetical protein LPTSP4_33970 [Leptospira ryugenii]|uniref:Uncharacterized protein n=1 Tax=Leptospira ryugenii TaxID=1917863 RepID=A0A2P2E4Q6_9LEPT|nr:hypothetical protein LPTSP4_33970 [Leptospira ryugenii]
MIRNALLGSSAINPELPKNIAVPIPRSLRKPSTTGSANIRSGQTPRGVSKALDAVDFYLSGYSSQFDMLGAGEVLGEILQESKRDLILVSAAYSEAKSKPGTCIPGGFTTVSITQSMLDEMVDGLERLGLSPDEAKAELLNLQNEGVLPQLGQQVPTPAMQFRALSTGDYDSEISYSLSDSIGTPQACPSNGKYQKVIRFNTELTAVLTSISRSVTIVGSSIRVNASVRYSNESGKKDKTLVRMTRAVSNGRGNTTLTKTKTLIEECERESANNTSGCVTLKYKNEVKSGDSYVSTEVEGRTDNDGGYLRSIYFDDSDAANVYFYEETFDAEGNADYYYIAYIDVTTDTTNDEAELGFYDSSIYGKYYESTYRFEGEIFVKLSNVGTTFGTGSFAAEDYAVYYPNGINPNNDPLEEYLLGYITGSASDGSNIDLTNTDDYYTEFYGDAADLTGLKVWRGVLKEDGTFTYTLITGTVVQI